MIDDLIYLADELVIDDLVYLADELVDFDVAGLVQSPAKVYFLEIKRLLQEEVSDDVLH